MPESGRELIEEGRTLVRKGNLKQIHTLDDWVYVWLWEVLPNVVKETTIRMYADTMERHVLPLLGNRELENITEQTIQDWVEKLSSTPVPGTKNGCMTEGTVRNTLSVLNGCMRDAQKYGLIKKNPCTESAWPMKSRTVKESQDWLEEEQIKLLEPLLAAYKDGEGYPIGVGFKLLIYTGITLSEAAALRWRDVDFEEEKLDIQYFTAMKWEKSGGGRKRVQGMEPLTGRKRREILAPGFLMRELRRIEEEYHPEPEDFVLSRSSKEPVSMDRMRAALLRISNSCGVGPVTPRMLRDTYAMRAVRAGAASDTIAEMLGFTSPQQVIRRYMPRTAADKKELLKRMFGE